MPESLHNFTLQIIVAGIIVFSLSSCFKETFVADQNAVVRVSVDTLTFDTVFTERGSTTLLFKIYNDYKNRLKINRIFLVKGTSSMFDLNVDGIPGNDIPDLEIGGGDSMYVFVQVTIDPNQPLSVSPFVIEEQVAIEISDNTQHILLQAWGQNANYLPNLGHRSKTSLLSCDLASITLDDPKPYVLYGRLVIDSCTLILPAGTQLYVHGGIGRAQDQEGNTILYNDGSLIFGPEGKLISQGTFEKPVVIRGDRLEKEYDEVRGQWNGIIFTKNSIGNTLSYTDIRNANFGVFVDSAASLDMSESRIFHTASYGLLSFHPQFVNMQNCAIYDNGDQSWLGLYGGNFNISYSTFANFGNDKEAIYLTDYYCPDFPNCLDEININAVNAQFVNCIVSGSNKDEFWIGHVDDSEMNLTLDHCLLKLDEIFKPENYPDFWSTYTTESILRTRTDSLFLDVEHFNYHLDTLSVVEGMAIPIPNITRDLDQNERDALNPDMGSYEYQY